MSPTTATDLLQRLLQERSDTAAFLHDQTGQALTAAVITLESVGAAPVEPDLRDEVVRELRTALGQLRDLSLRLSRPPEDADA